MRTLYRAVAVLMAIAIAPSVLTAARAQTPAMAIPLQPAEQMVLRSGVEVPMRTTAELSSRTNRQGDRFDLIVSEDVMVDGHVVIPRGSQGVGEIVRLVPKGAFGKSGKLETTLLYVAVGNYRIGLDGHSGDRGTSGTGATVATAVLAGVASAFVTGTSARIPAGSTMVGYVEKDLPLVIAPSSPSSSVKVPETSASSLADD